MRRWSMAQSTDGKFCVDDLHLWALVYNSANLHTIGIIALQHAIQLLHDFCYEM